MNKETLLQKKRRKKLFPWLKTFYSKCAEKFLDDNEVQALEYLSVNVDNEIRDLQLEPNEKKATELFNILDTILLHLNWKIHWKSFKQWKSYWKKVESPTNNTIEVQKRSCTKLLYSLLYLSLLLANGNKESEWVNRILTIFKIMPSLHDASYSALFLVDNLKKKYSPVYYLILKYALLNFTLKNGVSCLLYSKVILLFRRLLKCTNSDTERQQILSAALKQHPPADFISWLSLIDDNSIKNLRKENVMNDLLSRTYPDDLLRKLQEVLRQEEKCYQNADGFNNADHLTDEVSSSSNYQEIKSTLTESLSLNETEKSQVTNEINIEKILGFKEIVSPETIKKKKRSKDNFNSTDNLSDKESSNSNYEESKSTFSESLSSSETEKSQVTNQNNIEGIPSSKKTVSPEKTKKNKKINDNSNNAYHLTNEVFSSSNYQECKSTFSESLSLNETEKSQLTNKINIDEILDFEEPVSPKTIKKKKRTKDNFNNTDHLTDEELSCPNYQESKSTFSESLSVNEASLVKNGIKCEGILGSEKAVSPKKIKKKKKIKDTKMKKNRKNKKSKKKKHHKADINIEKRDLNEITEKTYLKNHSNDNIVEKDELISNDYLELHVSKADCLLLSDKQENPDNISEVKLQINNKENDLCVSKCEKKEKSKHKKKKKKKESKSEDKISKINKHKHFKETENDVNNQIITNDTIISNSDLEMCFSQTDRRVIPNYTMNNSFAEENSEEMHKTSSKDDNMETETGCSDTINVHQKSKSNKKNNKESKNTKRKRDKSQTSDTEMLETDSHHLNNNNLSGAEKLNSNSDLDICVSQISKHFIPNFTQKFSCAEQKSEELLKVYPEDDNVETEADCSDTIKVHKKSKKLKKTKSHQKESKKTKKKKDKSRTPETQVLETNSHNLDNNDLSNAEKLNSNSDLETCVSQISKNFTPNDTQEINLSEKKSEEVLKINSEYENVETEIDCFNTKKVHKKSKKLKSSKKHKKESKNTKKKRDKSQTPDTQVQETDSHLGDNNLSDAEKLNLNSDLEMCCSQISKNVLPNDNHEIRFAEMKSEKELKIFSEDENAETEVDCLNTKKVHKRSKKLKSTKKHKKESKNTKKKRDKSKTPDTHVRETDSHLDDNNLSDAEKLNLNSDLEMCCSQISKTVLPNDTHEIRFTEMKSEEELKIFSEDENVEIEVDCLNTQKVHKKSKKLKSNKKSKNESEVTEKKRDKSRTRDTQMLETDFHHLGNNNLSAEKLNSNSDLEMCFSQISKNIIPNDTQKISFVKKNSEKIFNTSSKDDNAETNIDCSDSINVHKKSKKLKRTKKSKKESKNKKDKSQSPERQILETDSHDLDHANLSDLEKLNTNSDLKMCFSQIVRNNIQKDIQKIPLTEENFEETLEKSYKDDNVETETSGCDAINIHKKSKNHKKERKNAKKDKLQTFETQLDTDLHHLDNNILSNTEKLSYNKIEKDENNRIIESITVQKKKFKANNADNDIDNNSPKNDMKNKNSKCKMKKLFNYESNALKAKDCIISHTLDENVYEKNVPVDLIKLNPNNEIEEDNLSNSTVETLFPTSKLAIKENPTKSKDSKSIGSLNDSDSNQNNLDGATTCSDISISELLKMPKINISRNNKALGIKEPIKNKNKKSSMSNLNSIKSVKSPSAKCHKKRKIDSNSSEESFNSLFSNNELIVASKNILVQTQASETYGSQSLFEEDINSLDFDDKQSNEAQLCSDTINDQMQNSEQIVNNNSSCSIGMKTDLISKSLTFESHQSSHVSSSLNLKISNSEISAKSSTSSVFSLSSSNTVSPSHSSNVEMKNNQNHCHSEKEINFASKPKLFLPYIVLEDIEKSFSKSSSSTFDLQSSISSKVINDCESSCSTVNSLVSLCQSQLTSCAELNKTENSPSPLSKSPSLLSPRSQTTLDKMPSSLPSLIENENAKALPCLKQNVVKADNQYESESNSLTNFDNNQGNNLFTVENSFIAAPKTISHVDSKEYISSIVPPNVEFFNDEEHSLSSTTEYQSDQNSLFTESETDSKNFILNNINEFQSELNRGECANIGTNANSADFTNSLVECRINNASNSNFNPSSTNVSSIQIIINLNKTDQSVNTNQLITNINFHSSSNSYEPPVVTSVISNQENAPVMANNIPVSQHFLINEASQTVRLADSNIDFLRPGISLNEGSQICTNSDINLPKAEFLQSSPTSTRGSEQEPNFSTPLFSNFQNSENLNRLNLNNTFPSSIYEDLKIINSQTNFYDNADSLVHSNMNHPTDNSKSSSTEKIASFQLNDSFSKIQDHDSRTGTDVYSSLSSDDLSVSTLSLISDIETELSVGENILISLEAKDHNRKCQTKKNNQIKCTLSTIKSSKASYPKKAPPRKRTKSGVSKSKKIKTGLCFDQNTNLLNTTIKTISDAGKNKIATNITPTNNSRYNFRNRTSLQKPRKFDEGNE